MKIKFQSGGMITYTPVFPQPLSGSSESNSSKSDKQEKITGTLQEEIIKVLKENGIQSDVDTFLVQANEFLTKSKGLSTASMFGGQNDYTLTDLVTVMRMANAVKQNKEQWTTASNRLTEQNAWDEVATTTNGAIYVYDEKKGLQTMSPDEYYENQEKYHGRALTNSQVLGLREQSSALAFNTSILKDLAGTLSITTIKNDLVDTITKFGNVSRSEYIKKTGDSISQSTWEGFQYLIANGPDGYYKATTKSERENVQSAVKYLWDSLGMDGKKRLRAEAAVSGADPNKNHLDLILQVLEQHTDYQVDTNFDKSASEYDPDGDGKSDNSSSLGEVPYLVRIGRGDGQYDLVNISMRTDTIMDSGSMIAWAANMGNMIDKDGNTLGMDTLTNIKQKAEALKATRSKDVTFGGQLLTDIEQNFIIYDGSSQLTDVWLPYKNVGGKITPDFDSLAAFNKWNDWVTKNPNASNIEKKNSAIQMGLDPNKLELDENGNWVFKKSAMKLFLSFSAYADDDNINFTKLTEDLTEEVPNEEGKKYADLFDNLFEYGTMYPKKGMKSTGMGYDTVRRWDLRRGNVFIPIDSDFLAKHLSMKEYTPKSEMNQFASRSTVSQQIANSQNNNIASIGQFK